MQKDARDMLSLWSHKHKNNALPSSVSSDGLMEKFNRTLLEMLSTAVGDEHDWDLSLSTLLLAYRISVQEITGTTPFQLMFPLFLNTFSIHYLLHHMIQLLSIPKYSRVVFKDPTRLPQRKCVVHFNRLKPAPVGNVPVAERIVNEEEQMQHIGDTVEENEEEEVEFTVRAAIIPQETVETDQPPIADLPTPPPVTHQPLTPAGLRQSSRKTKPPDCYGDLISLTDVWTDPYKEGAM
eukprot:Em0003g1093a